VSHREGGTQFVEGAWKAPICIRRGAGALRCYPRLAAVRSPRPEDGESDDGVGRQQDEQGLDEEPAFQADLPQPPPLGVPRACGEGGAAL
jgi:hypothetical protein